MSDPIRIGGCWCPDDDCPIHGGRMTDAELAESVAKALATIGAEPRVVSPEDPAPPPPDAQCEERVIYEGVEYRCVKELAHCLPHVIRPPATTTENLSVNTPDTAPKEQDFDVDAALRAIRRCAVNEMSAPCKVCDKYALSILDFVSALRTRCEIAERERDAARWAKQTWAESARTAQAALSTSAARNPAMQKVVDAAIHIVDTPSDRDGVALLGFAVRQYRHAADSRSPESKGK